MALSPTGDFREHYSPQASVREAASGPNDFPAPDLDRYLRQRSLSGTVHYPRVVRRVEDRAMAGAGELSVSVSDSAPLMGADCRIGHEGTAPQADQHRRISPRVFELHGRPWPHLGRPGDGLPIRSLLLGSVADLLARGSRGSPVTSVPTVPTTASSVVGPTAAGLAAGATPAGGEHRSSGGAHT